jgi:hypothetical protein
LRLAALLGWTAPAIHIVPVYASTFEERLYAIVNATGATSSAEGSLEFHAHSYTRITTSISPAVITGDARKATVSGTLEYLGDDSVWKSRIAHITSEMSHSVKMRHRSGPGTCPEHSPPSAT